LLKEREVTNQKKQKSWSKPNLKPNAAADEKFKNILDYWDKEKQKADVLRAKKNDELKQKLIQTKKSEESRNADQQKKMMETKIRLRNSLNTHLQTLQSQSRAKNALPAQKTQKKSANEKLQTAKKLNQSFQTKIALREKTLLTLLKSKSLSIIFQKFAQKLKNIFLSYRHLQNVGLTTPQEQISYESFYLFCLDFGLTHANLGLSDIKKTIVYIKCGLEKGDLEVSKEGGVVSVDFGMLDFDHFREALFVMAYGKNLGSGKIGNLVGKKIGNLVGNETGESEVENDIGDQDNGGGEGGGDVVFFEEY
jgi:hypothetical protein